jgi:methanogenic corrinoid protein MtbC1
MTMNIDNSTAPVYNLKAVVMETGLKPPTIRAWERRYGLPQPQRTDGGHRQYSERDIETLKWLIARQAEGISISHATELWRALVQQGEDPLQEAREAASLGDLPSPSALPELGSEIEDLRRAWVDACLSFDRQTAEYALSRAFALFSPDTVATEVLQKGLAEVGLGWYQGDISVQQEHFASALSIQRLEMLIAASAPPTRPERILVASAQGDFHVFSPLLLTYLLRRRGWDVIYLGADVPGAELAETIDQIRPDLVIMTAQLLYTAATLPEVARDLMDRETMFAYGGLAFNLNPGLKKRVPGHFLGTSLDGAADKVAALLHSHPALPPTEAVDTAFVAALAQFNERRPLIESHVWGTMVANEQPLDDLAELNYELAQIITAVLKLGDPALFKPEMQWLEYLLMSHRLSAEALRTYITTYAQAARIHLGAASGLVVDWLNNLSEQ